MAKPPATPPAPAQPPAEEPDPFQIDISQLKPSVLRKLNFKQSPIRRDM